MSDDRIVTRDFCLNTTISLFTSLTYFMLTASIASYAIWKYGSSTAEAGLAAGLFVIGGMVARLTLGRYIELVGRKRMLIFALLAALSASVLYYFTETFLILCITRVFHGAAYGICHSTTNDIVTKMLPRNRRGEGLGYFLLSITISTALGPMLALIFIGTDAYGAIFNLSILMNVLSLFIALMMCVREEELTKEQKMEAKNINLKSLFYLPAVPQSVVTMILMLSYSGVMSFLAVYSSDIGASDYAPYFYVAFSLTTLISRFTVGKRYDRNGANAVILPAYATFLIGMVIYAEAENALMFIIPGMLMGFTISSIYPTSQTMIVEDVPPSKYGTAVSTYQSITDMGTGFGPMIVGAIIAATSYRETYLICAGIAAGSLVLYWLTYGMHHTKKKEKINVPVQQE